MANGRVERAQLRTLHLLAAVPILGYFYGPLAGSPWVETLLRLGVLPALTLSGIVMWQLPRVRRHLAARRRAQALATRA